MRFDGKVLLVTGGASGIGAATARRFAAEGGQVAVLDLSAEAAEAVATEVGGLGLACNVADEAAVEAAVARVVEHFGRLDCVLNGAGHADFAPLEEWDWARWDKMMSVHVGGTFLVTKFAMPHVRASGDGAIVNVASVAALKAQAMNAPYGAAKGAIIGFTRQMALELAPEVRVNVIAPGRVLTNMTEAVLTERGGGDLQAGIARAAAFSPLDRMGTPEQMAGTICYLFSEDAGFTTGATIVADGAETVS